MRPARRPPVVLLVVAIVGAALWGLHSVRTGAGIGPDAGAQVAVETPAASVREIFEARRSGVMVGASGEVVRILSDDRDGSRHQRFVIELSDGLTLLVAHNIDLASRVPVAPGDRLELYGQYEWNDQGGVIHWTHLDPDGLHEPGWILHDGRRYE